MRYPFLAGATLAFAVCLGAGNPGSAQAEPKPDPRAIAHRTLGPNWIVEDDPLPDRRWFMPNLHSYLCRLRARGGFPYQKLIVSSEGKVLARSATRELRARARAESIRIAIAGGRPTIEGLAGADTQGLEDTLRAFARRIRPTDPVGPGSALAISLLLVEMLTVKGEFRSAEVKRTAKGEVAVTVDWKQGNRSWGFVEQARWTLRFDARGTIASIEKTRGEFEEHLRR